MVIEWTPSLSVGVEEIDRQHQELFRRAERLMVALRVGDRSEIAPLLEFLSEYAEAHFEAEEREMDRHAYPGAGEHRVEHDDFRKTLVKLSRDLEARGTSPLLVLSLHNWLSDWLRRHVGGADQALGRFLRAHA